MKSYDRTGPPKEKNRGKSKHQQPSRKGPPDASQGSGVNNPSAKTGDSRDDADRTRRTPITNQDEQDKITNEGSEDTFIPGK